VQAVLEDVAGEALMVRDIHHHLLVRGLTAAGNPSQAISNALRTLTGAGRAERVGWGRYRSC
jgi:hypothetical protein